MSAFKQLTQQDVYVSDYVATKAWLASGSLLDEYKIETLRGFSGSTPGYPYPGDYRNNRYQSLVYNSVNHSFLEDSLENGTFSGSRDLSLSTTLTLSNTRESTSEVGVVSLPKDIVGTGIQPGTVILQPLMETDDRYTIDDYVISNEYENKYYENLNTWYDSDPIDLEDYVTDEGSYVDEATDGEYLVARSEGFQRIEIIDDSEGRLVISGSEASYTKDARYVGDVIYNQGLVIITDPIVARYYSTYARVKVDWKSKLPIYTYNVNCTVRDSEMNYSFNPSAITGSENNIKSNITGSEFRPYVTTIGLYNEATELIAVAKLNKPIPKTQHIDSTFVVKFDI
jgi:hypothetical protein